MTRTQSRERRDPNVMARVRAKRVAAQEPSTGVNARRSERRGAGRTEINCTAGWIKRRRVVEMAPLFIAIRGLTDGVRPVAPRSRSARVEDLSGARAWHRSAWLARRKRGTATHRDTAANGGVRPVAPRSRSARVEDLPGAPARHVRELLRASRAGARHRVRVAREASVHGALPRKQKLERHMNASGPGSFVVRAALRGEEAEVAALDVAIGEQRAVHARRLG